MTDKTISKKFRIVKLPDGKQAVEEQIVIRGLDTQVLYTYRPIGCRTPLSKIEYRTDALGKIIGCEELD